jgi:two-component system CheB/CheR fusion protein
MAPSGTRSDAGRKRVCNASATPSVATNIPVAAIGASAGGLEPISRLLGAVPEDSGLAFVVIQHLDPASKSLLPELLSTHTTLRVQPATDGIRLMPNEVYVITPGVYLSLASGRLRFSAAQTGSGVRMPIDAFMRSLALDHGNRAIGIIMSGTGTDGA